MKIATLALIIQDGKVLLGQKHGGSALGAGTLNGPGGKLEQGESIVDCVIRETKEEFDIILSADALEKVAVITFYGGSTPGFKVYVYRTGSFTGEPRETDTMIPGWYDIHHLPLERMLDSDRAWFPKALRGEKFNAHVFYRELGKGFIRIEFLPFTGE